MLASACTAALPLLLLAVLLAVVRVKPWLAATSSASCAFLLAWLVWGLPFGLTLAAATHGMAFGLFPIGWVVVSAVFFYNLSVASGDFEVIRRSLTRLTADARVQVLLVAFCFGALVEGIAGFGAPVAITASMLVGLGFQAVPAAALALLANTAPVAFGSLGIPITTLGGILAPQLGADPEATTRALSAMVGRQLPFFSLLIPGYMVVLLAGWRGMIEVLPAVLTTGVSYGAAQLVVSNLVGPELTDTVAALAALAALTMLLRFWSPTTTYRLPSAGPPTAASGPLDPPVRVLRAYGTYALLVLVVLAGQVGRLPGLRSLAPPLNLTALLRCGQPGNALCPDPWFGPSHSQSAQAFRFPVWDFHWPGSYETGPGGTATTPRVLREPPAVPRSSPFPLTFRVDFLASAGTLVFLAAAVAFVPMRLFGLPWGTFPRVFRETLWQLRLPLVTIAFILSIATVMNYPGMTSSLALTLAGTGFLFPFFSAFVGMLGVFLTGSDTASNTLFGPLQATTAQVSGLDPILLGATNSSGGVMGKMISPQNLSVGAAGVGAVGSEGAIFRRVIGHSLVLTTLMGLLAMLQAYLVPWMVPKL